MNIQEQKLKAQRMIVQNLEGRASAVKAAVVIKDAFREKMEALTLHGLETYSQEYLEKEKEKVKNDCAAKMQAANTAMVKGLEELRGLYHDRDSVLDLTNPALTNGLSLISSIGSGLSFEDAVKINANFIHDQSSLRVLQTAYKAHGVVSPGNVDNLIYDANAMIDNLKELAYEGLVQEGSINTFANKLAKLAELEGLTIEKVPDAQGEMDVLRASAGLPLKKVPE